MLSSLRRLVLAAGAIVCLALVPGLATAQSKAPKPASDPKPSPATQQEFNAFAAKFRAALKANDAAAVEQMTKFPFLHYSDLRDAAAFRTKSYSAIFTAKMRSCVQRTKPVYDKDQQGNEMFLFFCGESILLTSKTPSGFLLAEIGVND